MKELPSGYEIKTRYSQVVKVIEKIDEGGQGIVYKVDYNGQPKALKWYNPSKMLKPAEFMNNLINNIDKGAKEGPPAENFVWPQDITEIQDGTFGYIMDLFPAGYYPFNKFLTGGVRFKKITPKVNTAINIVNGFRKLHLKGYSYQDLSGGNFIINPDNGKILIADNDNVTANGKTFGIGGTPGYMAPEIVLGEAKPNVDTDRYSLACVLFRLFLYDHPLEGKLYWDIDFFGLKAAQKIYGEDPVFIFDPKDKRNKPHPVNNKSSIACWSIIPKYIQELFIEAFSHEALHNPKSRIIDKVWLEAFIRLRTEVLECDCKEIFYADALRAAQCPYCKKSHKFPNYLKLGIYNIPLHSRTLLYDCFFDLDQKDYLSYSGKVTEKNGVLGLENTSEKTWIVYDPDGKQSEVQPGKTMKIIKERKIDFAGTTAQIL